MNLKKRFSKRATVQHILRVAIDLACFEILSEDSYL